MDNNVLMGLISSNGVLIVGGLLSLLAFGTFVVVGRQIRQARDDAEHIDHRLNTLWHELDTLRLDPVPNGESHSLPASPTNTPSPEKFAAERAVYEKLWPVIWTLHDRVGAFLRAVEHNEPHSETRLAARQAALDLRSETNRARPFINEGVDHLLHQLLDVEIKAHLAACQYLDQRHAQLAEARGGDISRDPYRQQWHMHYDNEAKELIDHLVHTIRQRILP